MAKVTSLYILEEDDSPFYSPVKISLNITSTSVEEV